MMRAVWNGMVPMSRCTRWRSGWAPSHDCRRHEHRRRGHGPRTGRNGDRFLLAARLPLLRRPTVAGAERRIPRWHPVVATIVFALLWGLVAARTSTTTYHLAPLLVAGGRRAARGRRIRSV